MRRFTVLIVSLLLILLLAACSGSKVNKVDLLDYVDVEFSGIDTIGEASFSMDAESAMMDLLNADNDIEIKDTLDELKESDPELYEKVVNLDDYFEISLSESEDLTNGDTINLVLHTSDQVDFIKDDEKEITVEGLEELEELTSEEVKEHVIFETIGADGRGHVIVRNNLADGLDSIEFTVENNGELKNGDQAKVVLAEEEEETLLNRGYKLEDDFNVEVKIEDLPVFPKEAKEINNLDDILRMIDERIEDDFTDQLNIYTYDKEKELTLYRQFDDEVELEEKYWADEYHYEIERFGSIVVLYTITEKRNDEVNEKFIVQYGYTNLEIDEDGNVDVGNMKSTGSQYSREHSKSVETIKQLYESDGYDVVE